MVNDQIQRLHVSLGLPDSEFFCECGHPGCKERVMLSRDEFATLRAGSRRLLAAAHVNGGNDSAANHPHGEAARFVNPDSEPMNVRIAKNESMFRAANERIELEAQARGVTTRAPFLCECPDLTCTEIVQLTLEEYEAVRRGPARFLCVPGHQSLAIQANAATVVEERPDVVIVDKIGIAGHIAAFYSGQDLDAISDGAR